MSSLPKEKLKALGAAIEEPPQSPEMKALVELMHHLVQNQQLTTAISGDKKAPEVTVMPAPQPIGVSIDATPHGRDRLGMATGWKLEARFIYPA